MNKLGNLVKAVGRFADTVGLRTPKMTVRWINIDFEVEDEFDGLDDDARDMRRIFNKDTGAKNFYPCEGHWNIRSGLLEDFEHSQANIYAPAGHPVDVATADVRTLERMVFLIEQIYPEVNRDRSAYPFKKNDVESFFASFDKYPRTLIKRYDVLDQANREAKPGKRKHNLTRLSGRIEHEVFASVHELVSDLKGGMGTLMAILEIVISQAYRTARKEERRIRKELRGSGRGKTGEPASPTTDSNGPTVDGEEEARAPAEAPAEEEATADIPTAEDLENDDTPTVIEVPDNRSKRGDLRLSSIDLDDMTRFLELYCRYHAYRLRQAYLHPEDARPLGKVRKVDHWQSLYMTLARQRKRDLDWKRMELWTDRMVSILDSVQLAARLETFFGKNVGYFMTSGMKAIDKYEALDEISYQLGLAAHHYGFWNELPEELVDDASQRDWSDDDLAEDGPAADDAAEAEPATDDAAKE